MMDGKGALQMCLILLTLTNSANSTEVNCGPLFKILETVLELILCLNRLVKDIWTTAGTSQSMDEVVQQLCS